ncbi:transcription termination/antitermination protein NusG [Gemella sp. GH3]|uniref:transcription termination/antitermination protein NusG n=1 Tax=unclassified Gemella TaxID=2624949 RepID=UPI0015D08A70|nr:MULTISPECIES: transcription termination/antitermination protein NusG [unclassified Gemella]MBF0713529.1 transcription termination/antitermination protein NusG [Gemella sp. GH3.1]NYS50481.1 transcription termination/antitermination protein NusG [Gemella sp. GH3]
MENTVNKEWYVIHTYSGYENKVKDNLEKRVETLNMEDKIFRIVVPEEKEVIVTPTGKKKEVTRKTFPGYVLVELVMTDDSWFIVRNTPGVTGFVGSHGSGSKPSPLLPEEINFILKEMGLASVTEVDISIGDYVNVISGPFVGMEGKVSDIDLANYKVDVMIELMGRETKVELELYHVEKFN